MRKILTLTTVALLTLSATAQKKKKNSSNNSDYKINSGTVGALSFRNIGPALTAGRISDLAVNPKNHSQYYITIASGGIFKTDNAGNTFYPIFDRQASYSIGCITIDPNNENVLWVGSGENNNQRSVGYGDGVYKSEDGGKSWKHMGLKNSEHIHKIIVDPNNSDIVYVASNGPLWSAGGDRGVYKTIDGGKNWKLIASVSENTGACDLVMDPRNSNVLYAAFQQRRRHVFTYIGGGPESTIKKSTDGGKTWNKITSGLPGVDLGRVGLGISPANPDVVYAIVEAAQGKGGFYKSNNRGASWSKMSSHTTSGNYYQEIVCHPTDVNTVYSMNTWLKHTTDGGKTFVNTGEKHKHVDNHCMWIDPDDHNHWLVGCDGGLYETWDAASNWHFKPNLPITQFYKVAVDNDYPFFNVYGGTQDNNSLGGPSRTINNAGILNSDWFITNGGDGFESQIDPKDPNIVYAQAQYGWLVRYDKKSGERIAIQPQPGKGEPGLRWNWDAPLLVSPHDHKTLYFSANKVFKSTDRGDSWTAISGDLTQQLDRNKIPVMGRTWSIDAVMKNRSTTIYGNIVAFDESPKQKDLLYAGTDDGLIQISEDGKTWKKQSSFPGVPANTYVNALVASQFDANTVYACFNNHKKGDFKPYLLVSNDKGNTWTSIANNLPERGSVYAFAQDHINKDLLFVGTEFGVFFSIDAGAHWTQLKSGIPPTGVRDIAIQRRDDALVLASFGRGFFVLDNYAPLRELTPELLDKKAHMYDIPKSLMYMESNPLGLRGVGSQGESMYAAKNPDYGTTFTFYLKEGLKTAQSKRRSAESKLAKDGKNITYPTKDEIRFEANEDKPFLLFVITDENGNGIKKIKTGASAGMKRITWNHRVTTTTPVKHSPSKPGRYGMADDGYLALPGKYFVEVYQSENGVFTKLTDKKAFEIELLNNKTLPATDKKAADKFYADLSELRRRTSGTSRQLGELSNRLAYIKSAIINQPNVALDLMKEVKRIESLKAKLEMEFWGDGAVSTHQYEVPESITGRIGYVVWGIWQSSAKPTKTCTDNYAIAKEEFEIFIPKVHDYIKAIENLEKQLDNAKSGYTPGRDDSWKKE